MAFLSTLINDPNKTSQHGEGWRWPGRMTRLGLDWPNNSSFALLVAICPPAVAIHQYGKQDWSAWKSWLPIDGHIFAKLYNWFVISVLQLHNVCLCCSTTSSLSSWSTQCLHHVTGKLHCGLACMFFIQLLINLSRGLTVIWAPWWFFLTSYFQGCLLQSKHLQLAFLHTFTFGQCIHKVF